MLPVLTQKTHTFEEYLTLQNPTNATIVAERPMYFDFYGDPGGTNVLGYTGG